MSTSSALAHANRLPQEDVWTIDGHHSTIHFSVTHHAVATFRSGFDAITGQFDGDTGQLTGSVRVEDMSLTGLDRLKGHILTPDFFDADASPEISFRSTAIEENGSHLALTGELTMRGVTKPLAATGEVRGPQIVNHPNGAVTERIGVDLTATIDRRDWGVSFNNEVVEGIANLGWDVTVDVALELVRKVEG